MRGFFFILRQWTAFRSFLLRRVMRYTLAEFCFVCGEWLPFPRLKPGLWQITLRINPMHVPAALERAQWLAEHNAADGWIAFQQVQAIIGNRAQVSASDLALTRVPARARQRLMRRDAVREQSGVQAMYCALEARYVGTRPNPIPKADTKGRKPCGSTAEQWTQVNALWARREIGGAFAAALPLYERGEFSSPFDALVWAERGLNHHEFKLTQYCLEWATQWIPESAGVWKLWADLATAHGERERAALYLERAASLNPEDIEIFLARQNLVRTEPLRESTTVQVRIKMPTSAAPDSAVEAECVVENASGAWTIHVLPPAGWGIGAALRSQPMDANHHAVVQMRAPRPDRVCGQAWSVTFVATNGSEYGVAKAQIAVPDTTRGKVYLVLTEDHELWEERGVITRQQVEQVLVEKSKFAAEHFAPWMHMVEVGSALAVSEWAAEQDARWRETRDRVREHLVAEVRGGNDIQPHLHAFNLPASPDFPYQLTDRGLEPNTEFLLTPEEQRRDFARAYTPCERIAAVAETVAALERLVHHADPNYRAVLWRSGQLEFGDTEPERAWSSVALLRAGLFADSDVPKKTFGVTDPPRTAFFAALAKPFDPRAGGELVQLPVTSNLEGDFLSDARTLIEIAARTGAALRDKPGVHVITLLTHDKFINARRGADEFNLDDNYNEWVTIRKHLDAWQAAGAERVLARDAIRELLDDGVWRLTAWLCDEAWLAETRVRYTIRLLGQGIPVSDEYPQWLLVTIPPFLRDKVIGVKAEQEGNLVVCEKNSEHDFWLRLSARSPLYCELELRDGKF